MKYYIYINKNKIYNEIKINLEKNIVDDVHIPVGLFYFSKLRRHFEPAASQHRSRSIRVYAR